MFLHVEQKRQLELHRVRSVCVWDEERNGGDNILGGGCCLVCMQHFLQPGCFLSAARFYGESTKF